MTSFTFHRILQLFCIALEMMCLILLPEVKKVCVSVKISGFFVTTDILLDAKFMVQLNQIFIISKFSK